MKPKKNIRTLVLSIVAVCVLLFGLAHFASSSETVTKMWLESTHTSRSSK